MFIWDPGKLRVVICWLRVTKDCSRPAVDVSGEKVKESTKHVTLFSSSSLDERLGDGDNSEFLENSEISEFFGRTIPNAILPFSCSSHHDSLKDPHETLKT